MRPSVAPQPPGGGPALPYCASIALDASGMPITEVRRVVQFPKNSSRLCPPSAPPLISASACSPLVLSAAASAAAHRPCAAPSPPAQGGASGSGERIRVPAEGEVVLVICNPEQTPARPRSLAPAARHSGGARRTARRAASRGRQLSLAAASTGTRSKCAPPPPRPGNAPQVYTFRVAYDLKGMPDGSKTYVRQKVVAEPRHRRSPSHAGARCAPQRLPGPRRSQRRPHGSSQAVAPPPLTPRRNVSPAAARRRLLEAAPSGT